jgi:hypothetical protein
MLRDQLQKPLYAYRDKSILPVPALEANQLTLSFDGSTIETVKREDQWVLTRPVVVEADTARIEEILREFNTTRAVDFIDTATLELARYGLEANPLVATVQTGGENAERGTLLVGHRRVGNEKDEPTYYALQFGRDQVFTVPQSLVSKLRPTVNDLRSREIYTLGKDEITSFTLIFRNQETALEKTDEGKWRIADDPEAPVDQKFASAIVAHAAQIKSADFFEVQPLAEQTELDRPILRIRMTDRDAKTIEGLETGRVIGSKDQVYARKIGGAEVFAIRGDAPGVLFLTRDDFLEKYFFSFEPRTVARIELLESDRSMTYEKKDNLWMGRLGDGDPFQVRQAPVESLILNVRALEWSRRLDPRVESDAALIKATGLENPERSVALFDAEGNEIAWFGQGNDPEERRIFLRLRGENEFYELKRENYLKFLSTLVELIPRQ